MRSSAGIGTKVTREVFILRHIVGAVLLLALVTAPQADLAPVSAQSASSLKDAPLTHLGIVCADLDSVARGYADLWGIAVPEIGTISFDLMDGSTADVRVAYIPLPNFYLELLQPITEAGLIHDHLEQFGLGMHHIGVGVDANVDAVRAELESKGGKWSGGAAGGDYAFVDFRHTPLGATLEIGSTERPSMPDSPTTQTGLFGSRPIGHVGLANVDADASRAKYIEVFGMEDAPKVRRFPPEGQFPFPPGHQWNPDAYVRTVMTPSGWNRSGDDRVSRIAIAVDSPYRHAEGDVAHAHRRWHGEIPRDEWLRIGQEKGGKWTNGGADSFFAYLDWSETLGLVIE